MSAAQTISSESNSAARLWGGGVEPFGASYGKLMMWFFLLSDAFTFSALLLAYAALRFIAASWPGPIKSFQQCP